MYMYVGDVHVYANKFQQSIPTIDLYDLSSGYGSTMCDVLKFLFSY